MSRKALSDWLERLERRAPESQVKLGLERVNEVWQKLHSSPFDCPVITVAGTNGKGSTVAFLEAICRAAGYSTLAYTSPHLVDFAERMRVDGESAAPGLIVKALDRVEQARGERFLSYFEHITLAALALAQDRRPDVLILEVGLGGRLDAVNVLDPDVAIITSIGLDHTNWLGRTRLAIGREKGGIGRPGRPMVIGEKRLPAGLADEWASRDFQTVRAGSDFRWRRVKGGWRLRTPGGRHTLPLPSMAGTWQLANAACAITALECLAGRLPLPESALAHGLRSAMVPGRLQRVADQPEVLLDVAHNPAAAGQLARALGPPRARSIAVFGALADKDVVGVARVLKPCFNHWVLASLSGHRGQSAEALAARLGPVAVTGGLETVESVSAALARALELAGPDDRIVVFGSFHTVAEAWPDLDKLK
jgi:dihydrofolate synthase / folylpolyglutamate synthase